MSKPSDHLQREHALSANTSFIVQAPAGSGKTELLTQRVLTLLTTVDEPEEILAITFTKKAASEMRQRVVELLQLAQTAPTLNDPYDVQRLALATKALEQDKARGWELMRNPQRLNLRTIDSLGTQLAHRLPITSTLGAPTGLIENASDLYRLAAERFIESNLDNLDKVLLHLDNKLERAQSLLAALLAKRDQWQRHVLAVGQDHDELRLILERMLEQLIESRLSNLCSLAPFDVLENLPAILAKAYQLKLALVQGDEQDLPEDMKLWQQMEKLPGTDACDLDQWRTVAFSLLTASNGLRKAVNVSTGFPSSKADAKKLGVELSDLSTHKQTMVELLAQLSEHSAFLDALVEVRELPTPAYEDEQWELLSQLLKVLPDLLFELKYVFTEQAKVDFAEVSQRASIALGTQDEPTDLALAMDLSLKHLLVDEFQDTSQTQFQLFEKLVSEWLPEDGKTFFAVGDPMQSIYRFREGDVALFTQVQRHGIGPVKVESIKLKVNFRSSPVVTGWVNQTFGQIFPKEVNTDSGAVPYSTSDAFFDYEGSVDIHALVEKDRDEQGQHVARLCAEAIADDASHTVAILVRSRTQALEIFTALRARELAYESIDMDLVGDKVVVRDLVSLTLALRYPHDRLHWLSLLRAPFVGLTLENLHSLTQSEDKRATIVEQLRDPSIAAGLCDDASARIVRFLEVIEPALKQASRGRLMPWVEAVWLRLGGPVACKDELDRDGAKRAIQLLYELEARNELWNKSTIESALGRLYANATDTGVSQIQVMTLHKSKGLEFDTVILPALDRKPRGDTAQLLNWFELTIDEKPQLLLAPFEQSGLAARSKGKLIKLVKRAGERCDDEEKLRLLYVACTRAKRHLHLVANATFNSKGELQKPIGTSLLAPLWPLLEHEFLASKLNNTATDVIDVDDADGVKAIPTEPEQLSLIPEVGESPDGVGVVNGEAMQAPLQAPLFYRLPSGATLPEFESVKWKNPVEAVAEEQEEFDQLEYSWAGRDARDIGTVVHDQLQMLTGLGGSELLLAAEKSDAIAKRQLINLGIVDERLDKALAKVKQAVSNALQDTRGKWILADHAEGRCEWALSVPEMPVETLVETLVEMPADEHGNATNHTYTSVQNIIIDRTFVDEEGTRWIVDYKTGDHEGGGVDVFLDQQKKRYAPQLEKYAKVIQRFDSRPIKLGLYFPMLNGWREWQPDIS